MSFTFNFDEGGNESEEKVYSNQQIVEGQINTNSSSSPPSSSSCRELTYTTNITYEEIQARCRVAKVIITNDFEFQFTLSFDSTDCKGYDLVPGKYEGGGKLWECSVDLARYIFKNIESLRSYSYGCCLELGCGHGLPGIICMKSLGLDVSFSDFNIEVLQNHTWPNIILNISHSADEIRPRARFFAGDWKASSDTYFQNTYFSFILTAETLYTEEHCVQVLDMIIRHLDVRGCALIASKKYYFGVGGGTGFLESLISHYNSRQRQPNDSHLMLVFECVCSHSDGSSNVREIIKITYNLV